MVCLKKLIPEGDSKRYHVRKDIKKCAKDQDLLMNTHFNNISQVCSTLKKIRGEENKYINNNIKDHFIWRGIGMIGNIRGGWGMETCSNGRQG